MLPWQLAQSVIRFSSVSSPSRLREQVVDLKTIGTAAVLASASRRADVLALGNRYRT
jgi:hypothetical protein